MIGIDQLRIAIAHPCIAQPHRLALFVPGLLAEENRKGPDRYHERAQSAKWRRAVTDVWSGLELVVRKELR